MAAADDPEACECCGRPFAIERTAEDPRYDCYMTYWAARRGELRRPRKLCSRGCVADFFGPGARVRVWRYAEWFKRKGWILVE